ncbi:MAG: YHS domain-containing protein [Vicinamibacterales bacterium]
MKTASPSRFVAAAILMSIFALLAAAAVASAQETKTKTVKDVVCGMNVDPETAKFKTVHEGETYYFCSESCLKKFTAEPAKYVKSEPKTVKDPVCGMTVETASAKHKTTHDGKTYYFCSESCLEKFKADPAKYIK